MRKNAMTILLLILVIGCNKDYQIESHFEVTNNSTHVVQLKVFSVCIQNLGQASMDTTYLFNGGSKAVYFYVEKTSRNIVDDTYIEPFMDADSAQIIFDGTHRISYKPSDNNPRNILLKSSYTGGKSDKRYFKYQYSITDEDYKNAVKIN